MDINTKAIQAFGDIVVDKNIVRSVAIHRLPQFIVEYLISKYCKKYGYPACIDVIRDVATKFYPELRDKDFILSKARNEGKITLMDEFRVRVDLKRDLFLLEIPSLQIYDALVDLVILKSFKRIFSGLWGMGVLEYAPEVVLSWFSKRKESFPVTPLILVDFQPFQVYDVSLKTLIEGRKYFTTDEWINFIIQSLGLNPHNYSFEQRILLLSRLIPLIEANTHILELGPRATGKTYLYRNFSYYTRIYAGGIITAARLFFDARQKIPGDILSNDVIVFDEITKVRFRNPDELVAKLKDFMVDGFFERSTLKRAYSPCSLVFIGNIDLDTVDIIDNSLNALPSFMRDTAFLDRIHGFILGWKLPKISRSDLHLARGYGLPADFLSEIFHQLRDLGTEKIIEEHFELYGDLTIRDEKAIRKLLSALIKLIFPHGQFDLNELRLIGKHAVKLRQNVNTLLNRLSPTEFPLRAIRIDVRG